MEDQVVFSVIVPYRNEASYIRACCEALQGQSIGRDRYEVLFVDNRSTDGTSELIGCAPGVTVIREERPGPYAARNAAIRSACADLPTEILDQHDVAGILVHLGEEEIHHRAHSSA